MASMSGVSNALYQTSINSGISSSVACSSLRGDPEVEVLCVVFTVIVEYSLGDWGTQELYKG